MTDDFRFTGYGLTKTKFFAYLSDDELRQFIDARILPLLDHIFGGRLAGQDLRKVAGTLVDFDATLLSPSGRRLVLGLLPEEKRSELRDRTGRDVRPRAATTWTPTQIQRLKEFFGLVEETTAPSELTTHADVSPKYALFDHQRATFNALLPLLLHDDRRAVLHLPTGAGKTRLAMHVVAHFLSTSEPSLVVWLASGRELLDQAVTEFQRAWLLLGNRPVTLASMWGKRTPSLDKISDGFIAVGLAKAWSYAVRENPDWAAHLSPRVRLVVFDEAHQTIAPTYQQLTGDFALSPNCAILGLTATPGRTWKDIDQDRQLAKFYGENKVGLQVQNSNPVAFLIEKGFLARPRFRTLLSEPASKRHATHIGNVARGSEISAETLDALSANTMYVEAVLRAVQDLLGADHRRILVFAATVRLGTLLTAIFVAKGLEAHLVTASTGQRVRDNAIRRFRSLGSTPVLLVNYGVLTTGFDVPKTSAVVIARPTKSLVLYSQMVGRAIRGPLVGGTNTCDITTVIDPQLPGFRDVAEAFLNWENAWK